MNSLHKYILVCCGLFLIYSTANASNLLLSYGFEDWTGDPDTTPGYPFGTNYESFWQQHHDNTEALSSSSPNCGGATPYEGTYYFRRQFEYMYDSCLGSTISTNESHMNVGYPVGAYGNNIEFNISTSSANTTGIVVVRFRFRLNDWNDEDISYGVKILRLYDITRGSSNATYLHFQHTDLYDTDEGGVFLYDATTATKGTTQHVAGMLDGNWHACCFYTKDNGNGTADVAVWIDDWTCEEGNETLTRTVTPINWELPYGLIQLEDNLSGDAADDDMSMDIDNLQVWDGYPTGGDTTPPVVTGYDPAKSETGVAKDTNIEFIVYDAANDVDLDTIVMTEESNYHCCSGMTGTCPGSGTKDLTCTDYSVLGDGYTVVYNPGVDYSYEQVVNVTIDADDTEANSMSQDVYSFTIESEPQTASAILKGSGNAWRFNGKKWTLE